MKRLLLLMLVVTLLVPGLSVFAGGRSEMVVDDDGRDGPSQFEGVIDIDRSAWEPGRKGGRFILSSFGSDPRTFNTVVAAETSSTDVINQLYAGAVRRNQLTLEWEAGLAESWVISDDQKSITYTLRPNLKWSDGMPLTARDFVDGVNRILLNPDVETNQRNGLFVGSEPSQWEYIDDRTFRVTLPDVYAGIFTLTSTQPLPMHILGPVLDAGGAAAINSFWGVDTDVTSVVGNGPFVIAEYVPGQRTVLRPNPYYYETDERGIQLPYLDEVVFVYVADQDTQLQRFLAGELSYYAVRGEDYAVLVNRKEELGFEMYNVGPAAATQFITFNQNPNGISGLPLEWLSNKTFRQAMAHLIDRETIINQIAFGFGYPQYSFIPTFSPYYWQDAPNQAFPFDPEKAAQMLDSINWIDRDGDGWREDPAGNRISLELVTNSGNRVREAIAALFAEEAARVGIQINYRPQDFNAMVGRLVSTYDWEMILIGLTGSVDPISGANVYPSSGNLHMIEPNQTAPRRDWERAVDAAWIRANNTTDESERKAGFETIQRIWIDEVPWVYTFNAAVMHAYKVEYGNIKPHPIDGFSWDGILSRVFVK